MVGGELGLYELLISETLDRSLQRLDTRFHAKREVLRAAEAADRISFHVARAIERVLGDVPERDRAAIGIQLARELLARVRLIVNEYDAATDIPVTEKSVLRAILPRLPDGTTEAVTSPQIPLLDTALLTNSPGEPTVGSQIRSEIHSADRIDVVMAFIRRSGILPLLDALHRHGQLGRPLRVLTTTYTGSTEREALDDLRRVGAQIRVSYDTSSTRLHAKAWLFHRRSGFSTAYVGSSNLTHSAQVSGLEWNVRVSGARNASVVGKVSTVFDAYWNNPEFEPYVPEEFAQRADQGRQTSTTTLSPIELRPEPFQERLLELIELSREAGHHRNLLVAATGTGKTEMAAVDYARLRSVLPRARLLFVAHREEILQQSLGTFRHALRDASFGELWVGGKRPSTFDHVFASIQSLAATGYEHLDPRHFDVVIVDEFHHAAAISYERLLEHVQPSELLGLTATPERSDGLSVLGWFGDRIAAELRLWDAIDQQRLVPFLYYGIADSIDLREVPWRRGRGYDIAALSGVYTASESWGRTVAEQLSKHVADVRRIRALGFCVSIEHAQFMARVFVDAGIRAVAIWSDTPDAKRTKALSDLANGVINVLFSVDLFNEGVDVPTVDTLLFLRPTDSPTLFLQQLGRGLRRAYGKTACTVLDFVGQHRREFRIDRRLRALLGGSRKDLVRQIENGFPFLPAGCHMQLDAVAKDRVLRSVREAIPTQWKAKADELRQLVASRGAVSLWSFLDESNYELTDVYSGGRGWSDLQQEAGLSVLDAGPHERALRRACGRLLHVDDRVRIDTWQRWLRVPDASFDHFSEPERRLLRMLAAELGDQILEKNASVSEALDLLRRHPQVCAELLELLIVLSTRIDHVHPAAALATEIPLLVHARYTRNEMLAALGAGQDCKPPEWREGVKWIEHARADVLAFTLDKTSGDFSPSTSYKDRAISRELIRWESQSMTRADSETGRRYREHAVRGTQILLFARLRADDRAFWFLGPATYVRHDGERPMAVTWKLAVPLPGDLYGQFAAAVA
jgi:superfamily II DNA or RNA helicase/HKD family nuclease